MAYPVRLSITMSCTLAEWVASRVCYNQTC